MNKILIGYLNIVFVVMLFPYITPLQSASDLQPWAFVFSFILLVGYLLYAKKNSGLSGLIRDVPRPFIILATITTYAVILFFVSLLQGQATLLSGARVLFGYFSVLLFALVGYWGWPYVRTRVFIGSMCVWASVALLQLAFGVHIVSFFLSRLSAGGPRGITGLASEPAFYATLCAAFLVLNEFFFSENKYNEKWYIVILLLLIAQINFSYAGVGIMLLCAFGFAKSIELVFLTKEKKKRILAFVAIVAVGISLALFFVSPKQKETRGGQILQQVVVAPVALYSSQLSISYRLSNPILGFYGGFIETKGLGFGIGTNPGEKIPDWLTKVHGESRNWGGTIEGGLSAVVYELGLVGFVYAGTILWILVESIRKNKRMRIPLVVSALVVFCPFAIFGSLAFPLFGFILGIHLYYLKSENENISHHTHL